MKTKASWNDEPLSDRIWFKLVGAVALAFNIGIMNWDASNSGWYPFLVYVVGWGNVNFALILLFGARRVYDGYVDFGINGVALLLLLGFQAFSLCAPLFVFVFTIPLIFPVWIAFSDCMKGGRSD